VTDIVRAAGGVPWRRNGDDLEVLLVHRGEYDDWSFPKGKNDPGESDEAAAIREVEEETGLHIELGPELVATSYTDSKGRLKRVRYWALEVTQEDATPQNEIDEIAWLSAEDATARLSYDRDRAVLQSFLERAG
jgi:8-oxo-dGTP pyrophosphatase MutT (NUDIX family)